MKNLSYLIYYIIFSLLIGQDYLWPTNASNTVTAFFAEERPRRYHAGIDIRTYGKNGFEIYAIENGYIEKVKINYKGYGNTIYLKLDDGNTAVYAHLEKFYPELNEIIKILKKDYNKQVIEHYFNKNELIVKKGDIIGYTGDTGTISGPHLHFEIRDKNNISLNPLANFYKIEDNEPPIPKKVALIPKNKNTIIDGSPDIMLYDVIKNSETEYYISDTISVVGKFGIALNIIDKVTKQPFDYGLYKIQLYIDGQLKYKIEYNEHNFSDGHLVQEERNYHLKRTENQKFYNLYNSTPNLSFIDKRSWPDYELNEGIHNLVIKASDVNNNEIIIFGTIITEPNEKLIYSIEENEKTIDFIIDEQDKNYEYIVDICSKYDGEVLKRIKTNNKKISIKNEMLNNPFQTMNLYGKKINGLKTKKEYYQKNVLNDEGKFQIKTFKHGALIQYIENQFSNKPAKINLFLEDSVISYKTNRIEQNILSTKIIDYSQLENLKLLQLEYFEENPIITKNQKINSMLFYPDNGIYLTEQDFSFGGNTNFTKDTTLIWIEKKINLIDIPENSTLLVGPYDTYPKTLIFKDNLNISFKYEDEKKGIGIYYFDTKLKDWVYLNTDYKNNTFSSSILSNEKFALLKENNAPKIKQLIPNVGATYRAQDIDNISFFIEDDLSGINTIDNILVKINNNPVLFEYNSYRKKVTYEFEEWLTIGQHYLDIEIKDNVGNVTQIKGEFTIK